MVVGVIPFSAPKNGGLHNILQPFLRGHVFLFIPISSYKKETTLKESTSPILFIIKIIA